MLRTLAVCYGFGFLCLFIGVGMRSEFLQYGYYRDYHFGITFTGKEVVIPIYGTILCSIALILLSIYFTIYGILLLRAGMLRDRPDNYVCEKCEQVFEGNSIHGNKCPTCGGLLEDLRGYYERHPEKKLSTG